MYGTFSISVGLMPMTTHMWIRKKQWKNHLKRSSKRYVRLIISQLLDKYVLHISLNPFSSGVIFYRISRQMSEFHIRSLGSKHAIDLHTERSSPLDRQHLRTQFSVATSKIPLVTQTKIFNSPTRENYDRWKTRPQFTWRHENPHTHTHTSTLLRFANVYIRKRICLIWDITEAITPHLRGYYQVEHTLTCARIKRFVQLPTAKLSIVVYTAKGKIWWKLDSTKLICAYIVQTRCCDQSRTLLIFEWFLFHSFVRIGADIWRHEN